MAQTLLEGTKLRIVFEAGMDEKGKQLYKAKTFSNINNQATADQLFQAAQAITALTSDVLNKVERNDSSEILA
ncbi:DUF1659 domain-containing protein [Paenibacillus sp. BSR1-1]|uniref:DUF1659 domain-containing protein n=1 Tax=Paenibacillus sp. BSR1-1 TaxID=3020845 RepID=UPI0025B25978|nr:DUF1659 domain-containing protein [Paenibacillus sp. BSR1-1]MDN3019551.1 DUF1659 domain-containing protein [Paenibacillus sp. BSR1-1]